MNTRDWPIRSKLTALVVVPVTALLALWIFATTLTFGPALDLLAARTLLYDLGRPGETVVAELQRERRLSVVHLAAPGTGCGQSSGDCVLPALVEQRSRTDAAIAELRHKVAGEKLRDAAGELLQARLNRMLGELDALPVGRGFIDRRDLDRAGAIGLYSGMISSAFHTFAALANLPDQDLNREALALTNLGRSRELLGQTDALLAGALTAGGFAEGERTLLVQGIGNHRFLADAAVADLPEADRAAYQRLTEQAAFGQLRTMQDELVAADPSARLAIDPRAWQNSYDTVQRSLRDFELTQADGLADRSVPMAVRTLARLAAAGLLGLIAVVVSLVVALRVGRSLAQRLILVRGTLKEAEQRLPDVVTRLRRGEQVDVAREVSVADRGADEIGQVAQAFTEVQKVAIRSAMVEVSLRRGLNDVFLNIARRSQGLVHRQLALLDRMERHAEDPDHLAELFRVDHLATRLRRHAEDLVILAGAAPGRGWRSPVSMVDLIRGAISEVESYDRVDITTMQSAGTVGRVVGDIIHLLAELIENATAFSPPGARVEISGEHVADGYALSITDQGLGMNAAAIEEANRKLARSPEFDPAETARLGLFVVARLAARHQVRVRLRPSDGTGLTAVVLIPTELITEEPSPLPGPDVPAADGRAATPEQRRLARATRLTTTARPRTRSVPRRSPESSAGSRQTPSSDAGAGAPTGGSTVGPAEADGLPRRIRRRNPAGSPAPGSPAPGSPAEGSAGAKPATAGAAAAEPSAEGSPGAEATAAGSSDATGSVKPAPAQRAVGGDGASADAPTIQLPVVPASQQGVEAIDGPTVRQPVVAPRTSARSQRDPSPRSPEEARRFMSALQAGTARGRLAAARGQAADQAGTPPVDSTGPDGPGDQAAPPTVSGPAIVESPTVTERDA
ncbi:Histidine kinase-, DNA gyrase B-, and HSP90-like ATPase [Micromonospora phaseoli]|uniref:histidine kinase n=1 Tax=Micromonospora phaseoli TaxID=1144548 RepID=A0A1H6WAA9_9ACTN|nr:nitrate- and nitrite sensing domain-containing protein [Micromonospora phaseoli]PZW01720.1 histidine kinase/DNA gyrase B/HSP90-like ATPase [Micromonospora phaseoli]GIJ80794.1 histidine kinase [Micromonospora phaseoli]SEJ13823.1 Histidine kinase-, DNA gyrase B-, and HSP90-like ATPase [Micromonospora phaseoli]